MSEVVAKAAHTGPEHKVQERKTGDWETGDWEAYFLNFTFRPVLFFNLFQIEGRLLLPFGKGHFHPSRSLPCWIGSHRSSFVRF